MAEVLARIRELARRGEVLVSAHGYDELAADGIFFGDLLTGLNDATMVEVYPDAAKGPSVLALQNDADGQPVHVVWGIPKGRDTPAVLITAYRPDPDRWTPDFMQRVRR